MERKDLFLGENHVLGERKERIDLECAYPPLTGGQSRSGFKKEGIDLVFSMAALLKVCVSFDS